MIEEYEVVPLGGDRPVPVELHVISATHRDIRQMIQEGEFREDLYYRLNGITLHLPLLRDRADKAELIEVLLHEENTDRRSDARSPTMRSTRCSTIPGRATSASCATCCAPPRRCAATA